MGSSRPLAGCAIVKTDILSRLHRKGKTIVTHVAVVFFVVTIVKNAKNILFARR
jgi:hypothetical protein